MWGLFFEVGLLQTIKNYNKSIPEGRKTVSLVPHTPSEMANQQNF